MMDHLLWQSETNYRQATASLAAGDNERALIAFQQGIEALLRWRLVFDGADLALAINSTRVGWPELLLFLDARYAVPQDVRAFLDAMVARYQQVAEGGHPDLPPPLMQHYAGEIQALFQRFYPRPGETRASAPGAAPYPRVRPEAPGHEAPAAAPVQRRVRPEAPGAIPAPAAPSAATAAPVARPPARPAPPTGAWGGGDLTVSPEKLAAQAARWAPPGAAAAPNSPAAARPKADEPSGSPGTTYETAEQRAARLAADQTQRALAAGQQRREMRLSGTPSCPRCMQELMGTEAVCPRCRFDLAAYRARRTTHATQAADGPNPSRLERLFRR